MKITAADIGYHGGTISIGLTSYDLPDELDERVEVAAACIDLATGIVTDYHAEMKRSILAAARGES